MFETGPGNLDAVRALRTARDVSAGSVFTTVYRTLPNDTDLSELAVLGLPALNFAFADGVERYHTSNDDLAHLNPGSLQHHGAQMLALARTFANDTLPRPIDRRRRVLRFPGHRTGDLSRVLRAAAGDCRVVLVVLVVVRDRKGVVVGVAVAIVAIILSALAAQQSRRAARRAAHAFAVGRRAAVERALLRRGSAPCARVHHRVRLGRQSLGERARSTSGRA